ncbi:MAG: transcriptional repressor LexA [Bacteriovoracia bacterium]
MVHKKSYSNDPVNAPSLTEKQAKVLAFIENEITRAGRPPTLRDIAKHLGLRAVGTVQDHVAALLRKGFLQKEEGTVCGLRPSYHSEARAIPILGMVPAGNPIEAIPDALGSLTVPAHKLRGELFALKVKGDSMIDAGILEGDLVVVKKQSQADHGQIVVAMLDGEATVKRLDKAKGRLRLLPENSRYAPIELDPTRDNVIQGVVVSVQRFLA